VRGGTDIHFIRIYGSRKKGRRTKQKKKKRTGKHMGHSFLRQYGTWKLLGFSNAE
jgi:hypothetical protein